MTRNSIQELSNAHAGHVLALYQARTNELVTWAWHPADGPATHVASEELIAEAGLAGVLRVECETAREWMEPGGFAASGGPSDLGEPDTREDWLAMLRREVANARRARGLRAKPENLGVTPLEPGEGSVVARVRGPVEVVEWWASLEPVERGRVLRRVEREAGE